VPCFFWGACPCRGLSSLLLPPLTLLSLVCVAASSSDECPPCFQRCGGWWGSFPCFFWGVGFFFHFFQPFVFFPGCQVRFALGADPHLPLNLGFLLRLWLTCYWPASTPTLPWVECGFSSLAPPASSSPGPHPIRYPFRVRPKSGYVHLPSQLMKRVGRSYCPLFGFQGARCYPRLFLYRLRAELCPLPPVFVGDRRCWGVVSNQLHKSNLPHCRNPSHFLNQESQGHACGYTSS